MKVSKIKKISWIICFGILLSIFFYSAGALFKENVFLKTETSEYQMPWPGILPDNNLYKLKVLRNKIIERLIIGHAKKVEYDLLMADKTIYASKLLMDKNKVELAAETALKGENYYSMLVQDYNNALLDSEKIPSWLDKKITKAAVKHQELFKEMEEKSSGESREAFQATYQFSKINYDFIVGLRDPQN